jgi:hypothetical protein
MSDGVFVAGPAFILREARAEARLRWATAGPWDT